MDSDNHEEISMDEIDEWLRNQGLELDDKTDTEIIPCLSICSKDFHDGLAAVQDNIHKWGFIDRTGKIVVPCIWSDTKNFHEGLLAVQNDNNDWGFVDKMGKEVIPCIWKGVKDFHEG